MARALARARLALLGATGSYGIRLHVGLGLIAAAILAADLWIGQRLDESLASAMADTALSGRQEALIERIAFRAAQLARAPAPGVETQLAMAVAEFDAGNRRLSGAADGASRLIHVYFESGALSLTALARRYLDLARGVLEAPESTAPATLEKIARLAGTELAAQQAEATDAFQASGAAISDRLSILRTTLAALLATLAAVEAGLVARPLRAALVRAETQFRRDDADIGRLGAALETARAEAAQLRDRLVEVGWTDPLTGLMNRGHFQLRLEADVARAVSGQEAIGVMAIRIGDLRTINETLGHARGDAVLREIAGRLRDAAPEAAFVARTGGTSFALAARATVLEELRRTITETLERPAKVAGRNVALHVRIGTAIRLPGETAERLLGNADIALGRSRGAGSAQPLAFTSSMRAELGSREALLADLRSAIESRAFEAHFQPQVGLGGAGLRAFEVLARWPHPENGVIGPPGFLTLAEEAGLDEAIDGIVLDDALATLARLRGEGLAIPRLSINASVRSLLSDGYANALRDAVEAAGLTPGDLTVEVSEARLREIDADRAQDALNRLCWSGFDVEVDGFGTGLAAFSTLSRLPVTGVKLDRALVAALPDAGAENVLRALTGLARDLRLSVVAEGIQSSTSLGFLAGIGVEAVQGFGLSRALSAADVRSWMGADRIPAA